MESDQSELNLIEIIEDAENKGMEVTDIVNLARTLAGDKELEGEYSEYLCGLPLSGYSVTSEIYGRIRTTLEVKKKQFLGKKVIEGQYMSPFTEDKSGWDLRNIMDQDEFVQRYGYAIMKYVKIHGKKES